MTIAPYQLGLDPRIRYGGHQSSKRYGGAADTSSIELKRMGTGESIIHLSQNITQPNERPKDPRGKPSVRT